MTTALATTSPHEIMPAFELEQMKARRAALVAFVKDILIDGMDYGPVGGARKEGDKSRDTLKKPGAEKLATFFGIVPHYETVREVEDWDKGLFFYRYRCVLTRNGESVGEGIGSCNSREVKYRYRTSKKVCPECNQPTIRRAGADWGACVWYCHRNSGGCGTRFERHRDDEHIADIEAQPEGRETNKEPFDLVNTIDKMAQKRALVAGVLVAVNASEFFTQDMEDFEDEGAPAKSAAGKTDGGAGGEDKAQGETRGGARQSKRKPVASRDVKRDKPAPAGDAAKSNGNGHNPGCGGDVGEGNKDLRLNSAFMAELDRVATGRGIDTTLARGILADTARGHGKASLNACDNYWRNSLTQAIEGGNFDHLKGAVRKGSDLPGAESGNVNPSGAGVATPAEVGAHNPTASAGAGRATVERLAELMEMLQAVTLPDGLKERWFTAWQVSEWGELPAQAVEDSVAWIARHHPGIGAAVEVQKPATQMPFGEGESAPAQAARALAEFMPGEDEVGATGTPEGWDKFRSLWDSTAVDNKWAPEYANTLLAKRLGRVGKTGRELDTTTMWRRETIAAARANRIDPKNGAILKGDGTPQTNIPAHAGASVKHTRGRGAVR